MLFLNPIIFGNYMRHIRSYAFLITMAISIYATFAFIPTPDSSYTTLRFGAYTAVYNGVWISYVSAIMLSVFLSLGGYFLIQGSLKKDEELGIGALMGGTVMSNTRYVFSKAWSNFLLLGTILSIAIFMSMVLMVCYTPEEHLSTIQAFLFPYVCITVPSLFCVAVLAVLFEVLFYEQRLLQYIAFLAVFFTAVLYPQSSANEWLSADVLGIEYVTQIMEHEVQNQVADTDTDLNIGFIRATPEKGQINFSFLPFSFAYLGSRIVWILGCCGALFGISFFFHRFAQGTVSPPRENSTEDSTEESAQFGLSFLGHTSDKSGGFLTLLRMEMRLLYKQNSYWQHLLVIAGFIFMLRSSLEIAHMYVLPLVWALQFTKWSKLVTREYSYQSHYFSATADQPIKRVFLAKILAGILAVLGLALPVLIRYGIAFQFMEVFQIVCGGIILVSSAVVLGVLTKSGKLFEVLFILVLYGNLNQISFLDYFGAMHASLFYTTVLFVVGVVLLLLSIYRKTLDYE